MRIVPTSQGERRLDVDLQTLRSHSAQRGKRFKLTPLLTEGRNSAKNVFIATVHMSALVDTLVFNLFGNYIRLKCDTNEMRR